MTRTRGLTEYQAWVRVMRMAAAVIGASLALWLLGGDRDPDASTEFTVSVRITAHDTYDIRGIRFFELRSSDGVGFVINADGDTPIARWLLEHRNERVSLTIQPAQTLRRDGQ